MRGNVRRGGAPLGAQRCTECGSSFTSFKLGFAPSAGGPATWVYVGCSGDDWNFSARLPPGNYRVLLEDSYEVQQTLSVTADLPDLVFDVPLYQVAGKLLENGVEQWSMPSAGALLLASATGGRWSVDICQDRARVRTFARLVPAGTYDVTVDAELKVRLPGELVVEAGLPALTLDVHTIPFSGRLTIGGSVPVAAVCQSPTPLNRIAFVNREDGLTTRVTVNCWSGGWTFAGKLAPGVYDVWLEAEAKSGITTARTLLREELQVTDAPLELTLDAALSHVSGRILENGVPLMGNRCTHQIGLGRHEYTYLHITDEQSGQEELLPVRCTEGWRYDGYLRPGSYRLRLETSPFSDLGHGTFIHEPASLHVSEAAAVQELAVTTRTLEISLRSGGADIVDDKCTWYDISQKRDDYSILLFRELSTGKEFRLAITCVKDRAPVPWHATGKVQPGVYHVFLVGSRMSRLPGTHYLADALEIH